MFKAGAIPILIFAASACASAADCRISGKLTDMQAKPVAGARLRLTASGNPAIETTSSTDGAFGFASIAEGNYQISAVALGFAEVKKSLRLGDGEALTVDLQFSRLVPRTDMVTVSADVRDIDVAEPDPAVKVFSSENLMDANPGRPGAPISVPGYPAETASSGIKAPQYFAPGVAGDHGEPIAQYVQLGSYLLPNNLSANAHGNGYADPNIYIANVIESVQVDGGAYNVRKGNHALNLATTYGLRSYFDPFLILTGDTRDLTATAGLSLAEHSWVAIEGSYGNGFLARPEHRKQAKINGGQVFRFGRHTLTLLGIGYYGFSYIAGLIPIFSFNSSDAANGWKQNSDTIDPRQKDQTHTAMLALNDVWKLRENEELQFSAYFRTYNLSLYSDFGDGLIRQSEFRTVTGGSVVYRRNIFRQLTLLAGTDYQREASRRDDLDHYNFFDPVNPDYYGPFIKVTGNNVTIAPLSSYAAVEGRLSQFFHYYLGFRRDEISINNQDLLTPSNSRSTLIGLNSPKVTITFFPRDSWWLPEIAFSFGKSYFTEDPRTGLALGQQTANGVPGAVDPVETARSYQFVIIKQFGKTNLKLTFGHETQSAEYGKIDPDTGLQFDLGPGQMRYLAATLRRNFSHGSLQATYEQADARDRDSGQITPEAPRLIGDLSWTYDKLPFHLQSKGEFEYVGRKVVGKGCDAGRPDDLASYCIGVPNKEFRFAIARQLLGGRVTIGVNTMIAKGYTGQTTEAFALDYKPGHAGPRPVPNNPISEIAGVRIPSYASVNFTYKFGR